MKTLISSTNPSLFPILPSLIENFLFTDGVDSTLPNRGSINATLPAVNIRETNDDFVIEVAAPGLKREEFRVELDNNVLVISSQRDDKQEEKDQQHDYVRREFSYHAFQRSFALPQDKVTGDNISARYEDGILHITVPKKEEAKIKPPKQIAVA